MHFTQVIAESSASTHELIQPGLLLWGVNGVPVNGLSASEVSIPM